MALGAGIAQGGVGRGLADAATAAAAERNRQFQQLNFLATYKALTDGGVPPQEAQAAISNPSLMRTLAATPPPIFPDAFGRFPLTPAAPPTTPRLAAGYGLFGGLGNPPDASSPPTYGLFGVLKNPPSANPAAYRLFQGAGSASGNDVQFGAPSFVQAAANIPILVIGRIKRSPPWIKLQLLRPPHFLKQTRA